MAELITLTTPITTPNLTTYYVNELHLNWGGKSISIGLVGTNGETKTGSYGSTTATAYMNLMNTKNFSSTSMHKEIMKRLNAEGIVVGTISGSPDT